MNNAQKFLILVFGVVAILMFYAYQTGTVVLNWNDFFNGTLQTFFAVILSMASTMVLYRYLYHRKSKR